MFYGGLDVLEHSREICNVLWTCKMFYTFKSESSMSFRMFYRSLGLLGQKLKVQFGYLTRSCNQVTKVHSLWDSLGFTYKVFMRLQSATLPPIAELLSSLYHKDISDFSDFKGS